MKYTPTWLPPPPIVDHELVRHVDQELSRISDAVNANSPEESPVFKQPDTLTLTGATSSDVLADVQTPFDGNLYTITEVGAQSYTLDLDFSNIARIEGLATRMQYDGGATHWIEIQLYNYVDTQYDTWITVENSNGQNYRYIKIPDDTNYINNDGEAIVRLAHTQSGTNGHFAYVDYVSILE